MLSARPNGGWAHEAWPHDKDDARRREVTDQGRSLRPTARAAVREVAFIVMLTRQPAYTRCI
jgi:hypothetical protein